MEENIITQIINNFDFAYMLTVNALTYFIIKNIDDFNGDKAVSTWAKRLILIAVIIVITTAYAFTGYEQWTVLVNSACAAPVAWSWVFKPILTKLGLSYKKDNYL